VILDNGIEIEVRRDEADEENVILEFVDPDEHGIWVLIAMPIEKARELGHELLDVKQNDGVIL
jgi:hypothetical protein|tara:strand:+ start:851 stop:1039 length:189 start_codon:yes stop_codon:yes gene_type:complete